MKVESLKIQLKNYYQVSTESFEKKLKILELEEELNHKQRLFEREIKNLQREIAKLREEEYELQTQKDFLANKFCQLVLLEKGAQNGKF